ncbi:zinc finger and BTB domain-containing protein 17-like isoform X2 [Cydia fagiglandana]|uniref:zinc finger and BTB domain-containing protein 17-like isoform X2 n=1 Tax=Cydia fagiglandana TaxID=1458189 RepID=UPI002FEE4D8D
MATVMKVETEAEACCVCGGGGGELLSPEEHDAAAPPLSGAPPLRTMLLQINNNKVLPEGRICGGCARRAAESYEFSCALSARAAAPLGDKLRALRRRLHELTQRIDVFIVVGGAGAAQGTYSEEDIIMVEKDALAAAAAADDEELERARNARGDHVYQCSVCPLSFQRVSEYRTHMATHPTDALHSCWTCGAQFTTPVALREHQATHAPAPQHAQCNLCHTQLQSQSELRRHEQQCPSRCPCCALLLADRAALAAHVGAAHGRAGRQHACPACFLALDTAADLSAHVLRHRQARQFVCGHDGCILRFGTRSNLMSHIRKCHGGAEEAQREPESTSCAECGRTFASVAAMKRHARVHRNAQVDQAQAQGDDGTEMLMMEAEELEGEVEYLEVETLEDADLYADRKPQLPHLH